MLKKLLVSSMFGLSLVFPGASTLAATDTTPPAVNQITLSPEKPTAGSTVSFFVDAKDDVAVTQCRFYLDGTYKGLMTFISGQTYRYNQSFGTSTTNSNHTAYATCRDAAGNSRAGNATSFIVAATPDTTAPSVGNITIAPSTPTAGTSVSFTVTPTDNRGVTACFLTEGNMTASMLPYNTSSFRTIYLLPTQNQSSSHVVTVRCQDAAGNSASSQRSYTVNGNQDTTAPTVSAVHTSQNTTTLTAGTTVSFYVTADDNLSGVTSCAFYVDGDVQGNMSYSDIITYRFQYAIPSNAYGRSYSIKARCYDGQNNSAYSPTTIFNVNGNQDYSAPNIGTISLSPSQPVSGQSVRFSVNATDNTNNVSCDIRFDDGNWRDMYEYNSDNYRYDYTFTNSYSDTSHSARVRCVDGNGNSSTSDYRYFTVRSQSYDNTTPTVGDLGMSNDPRVGFSTTFTVYAYDNSGINSCWMKIDGNDVGKMQYMGGNRFDYSYIFQSYMMSNGSSHNAQARCTDMNNISNTSPIRYFTVSNTPYDNYPPAPSPYYPPVAQGSLVKLACGVYAPVQDPCHAVYYVDGFGKRHPFINERIFMSWFSSWGQVQEISSDRMSQLTMSNYVPYRPGTVMVKFSTDPKVYEIDHTGALRWVQDEQTAIRLRGNAWPAYLVGENDGNYSHYRFGSAINYYTPYSVSEEYNTGLSLEQLVTMY